MIKSELMETVEAVHRIGSKREAARVLGIPRSTLQDRYNKAVSLGYHVSEGIQQSVNSSKLGFNEAKAGWIVDVDKETGSRRSTYWKAPEIAQESLIDAIKTAFEGITPAQPIPAPLYADSDLLTIYPIPDAHVAQLSDEDETGEEYNTLIAVNRIKSWVGQLVKASPASGTAIILGVGDLTHGNDQTNQTPQSKHQLDVATRHFRTLNMTIEAMATAVELAAAKHDLVIVRILPGNHDRDAYMAVMFALSERYRDNERINVHRVPGEFFAHEFGKVMIVSHHGDKSRADRMVMYMADTYPELWGRTKYRFLFTGHLHHAKMQDIGGVQFEQLRAVTAKDAYAASHAFSARAQLQAITMHRERGEVSRVKINA